MGSIKRSWLGFLRKRQAKAVDDDRSMIVPHHLGIIMDGNGRWAKLRGLPRKAGHRAGAETLHDITDASGRLGVRYLTVYAFSTENWKRPDDEVTALMSLFTEFFYKYDESLAKNNVRVRFMGERSSLPTEVQKTWVEAEEKSIHRTGMQLIVAFNYGGQKELVQAARRIATEAVDGQLDLTAIDERTIAEHLYLSDVPPLDLIIRSSGELRLSNFMIWQGAYAELWVSNILWPDFRPSDLEQAFRDFAHRERRYGAVSVAESERRMEGRKKREVEKI